MPYIPAATVLAFRVGRTVAVQWDSNPGVTELLSVVHTEELSNGAYRLLAAAAESQGGRSVARVHLSVLPNGRVQDMSDNDEGSYVIL